MDFSIDNSMAKSLVCPAQFCLKHIFNRAARTFKYEADLGNVVHKCLEAFYTGTDPDDLMPIFEHEYEKIFPNGEIPPSPEMFADNVFDIIYTYCVNNPPYTWFFEVLEAEKTIGIEIEPGVIFYLTRDMLIREKTTGAIMPWDHKTKWRSPVNDWWLKKFITGSQLTGYIFGTREEARAQGLKAVNKIHINILRIQKLPDETDRKCRVHKMSQKSCRLLHVDWQLKTYYRSEDTIKRWFMDLKGMISLAKSLVKKYTNIEILRDIPRWGAFTDACTLCEFIDCCQHDFNPDYTIGNTLSYKWSPWETKQNVKVVRCK